MHENYCNTITMVNHIHNLYLKSNCYDKIRQYAYISIHVDYDLQK